MMKAPESFEVGQDLATLYEIALSIGRSLDLVTNCDTFLTTLATKKLFDYAAVWIVGSRLVSSGEEVPAGTHLLVHGLPRNYNRETRLAPNHPILKRLAEEPFYTVTSAEPEYPQHVCENFLEEGAFSVFDLGGLGFVKVHRPARFPPPSPVELRQLANVIAKFAVSVEGCLAYRALAEEIGHRKALMEALQASEAKYRALVDMANDGIAVVQDGRVVFANPRLAEMAGRKQDELIGESFVKYIHPSEIARVLDYHRRRLAGLPAPNTYETRLQTPDGSKVLTVELTANMITFDGKPAILALVRDISERRRIESERAQLALALEQTTDAVVMLNPQGQITYVNPAFENLWGRTRDQTLNQEACFIASEDMDVYRTMLAVLSQGRVWRGRLRSRGKTDIVVCDVVATPTRNEEGQVVGYVCVLRDITRELKLEEQYLQAQKMDSIGRLAGGIAHDFNNIMTAILGFGTMILEQVGDNHTLRHAVEQIVTAGERATNLTRQLLTFSRRHMAEVKLLDLNAVLVEMLALLKRALGEDIELVTQLDEDAGYIRADPGSIQQVIMNLAINARDAMPRGGRLTIRTRYARLSEEFCKSRYKLRPGDYVLLMVSDTGVGMPPEVLAHAFEPFFTTKPKGQGTGLGLSTVYAIVEQCRGHIEIESEVNKGTTVYIWIPRAETPADAVPVEIEDEAQQGTETILVVEDEDVVRDLTVRILRSLGYTVLEATNGQEGLAIVERLHGRVHLVLTDVVMPQMGGPEMAEKILSRYPSIKVVYTSGFAESSVTEFGKTIPPMRWIAKPYTREILAKRIRENLDQPIAAS